MFSSQRLEMVSFSLTYCVLLVRKSKIQAMRFLFAERDKSFSTIICGWMVLNADEKSMNRMRTNEREEGGRDRSMKD